MAALVVPAFVAACSSSTIDLYERVPPTDLRVPGEPLDTVRVRLGQDRRPLEEHGVRRYLGTSYLAPTNLREPTEVTLLRVLVRDLVLAEVARRAGPRLDEAPYVLSVEIIHLGGSYEEGLANLAALFPAGVDARCELRVTFRDRDGRLFLDRTIAASREESAAPIAGLDTATADALGAAIREAVDRLLPLLPDAVTSYWKRFGRSGPPEGPSP